MAFRYPRLQDPIVDKCEFCEESIVKWKCINCKLFLCDLCRSRIHSKIESYAQHYVINFKDLGNDRVKNDTTEKIKKVSLQNLKCSVHSDELCCIFCNDCRQPICVNCLIDTHQNHKHQKLNEVFDKKVKVMKDVKYEIDSYIPYFTEEENKLQEKYNTGQNTYQNNKDTISNITDDIMKYSKKLQSQLDKQWMPAKNLIYAELLNVRNIKGELVKRKHNLEQTLTSPNASDVLTWTRDLDEMMPDKNVRQFEFKPTQFKPGRIATDTLTDSFGAVCGAPYFRMVDSYETCLKSINKLVMCDNDSAFIGSYDEKLLVKITFKHRAVKVDTRVPNLPVYDMAMMNNGDLLISTQTKDLNLYTKEGVLNIFKSFPHNITLGVHVSQCDEISVGLGRSDTFVGSLKPYAYYKHNPNFDSRIEIMNLKGDTMHTIKYSDNSIYPSRICTFGQFIYVINDGKFVVLDKLTESPVNSNLTNRLGFQSSVTDLTLTSSNQILLLDKFEAFIHVLSPSVQSFDRILLKDLSISNSSCLHVSSDGLLLIGTGRKHKRRAIIYAIRIT